MKYISWILGLLGLGTGFAAGYYVGKNRERNACEADIASVKEEYQKRVDETKRKLQKVYGDTKPEDEEQKLTENGDIDDLNARIVTYQDAVKHNPEDVIYFAADNVWYNETTEKTYNGPNIFVIPSDLFRFFGEGEHKEKQMAIATDAGEYFLLTYEPGSYAENILGYSASSGGKEE